MKQKNGKISYTYKLPSEPLEDFVDSYWEHVNHTENESRLTIFPDSFFKLIIEHRQGKIVAFFMTGLWKKEMEVIIPANATVFGIKFKLLAPEYIFHTEIASLLQSYRELNLDFWNIRNFDLSSFHGYVQQIESLLIERLKLNKPIKEKKRQLSKLLYSVDKNISAEEVSMQINWRNRQINRYLNKYLGVSLKTYLNIRKCYSSYFQIREGQFHPDDKYFDQAHFIREIKKHTGKTPKELYKQKNDRFVQLSNFPKK